MNSVAAVDLGASGGRVILGRLLNGALRLKSVARFSNDPVITPDGLHWNLLELYRQMLLGLLAAERETPGGILSIGIDSWAVDYGLLRKGRLLGLPFHYRDERTAIGVASVHARASAEELFNRNGLQHLPFNTLFQLAAEGEFLGLADKMLLIPDLLNYWLTGETVAERTNASTTGLLDPYTGSWDLSLVELLNIPTSILPRLVDPGTRIGVLNSSASKTIGRTIPVTATASHDTASAVVAIPNLGSDFAFISCGTWGLVGVELDAPLISDAVRKANFTNEQGVDGRTRFLRNVMGLWMVNESLRCWFPLKSDADRKAELESLLGAATRIGRTAATFDVDDPVFTSHGDFNQHLATWYKDRGEQAPETPAQTIRVIFDSLAAAFSKAVMEASLLSNKEISVIHIVGGGSQIDLLCQSIADQSGLPVLAGPIEATAIGNVLVQLRGLGLLDGDLTVLRRTVIESTELVQYQPRLSR